MLLIVIVSGFGKGIRSVYMSIVVPSYIPLERLASASAIQLFTNGIVMMCIGPILGMLVCYSFYFSLQNTDEKFRFLFFC